MDDEEDAEARARRQARREREGKSAPSPAKRKGGAPAATAPRLQPLSENETIQDRAPSPVARPAAPTPKKASAIAEVDVASPNKLGIPRGPRPPNVNRASYASSNDSNATPSIVLQEATPTKDHLPHGHAPSRPRSIDPVSPLNVPMVQDEQLQNFFNEVANQLNTMNIRSSVASGSSTSTANALGNEYQAYMAYANGLSSGPVSPVIETSELEETVDPNQFADADDDETEMASVYSHGPSSSIGHGATSPLVGLGFGHPPVQARPGLYPVTAQPGTGTYNTNRWSYASSAGSSRHPAESPSPQLYSPHPWSPQPEPTPIFTAQRSAPPAPPPRMASRPAPPPPRPVSAISTHQESLLRRDESYVLIDNADVPASDSSWGSKQSGFSAHRNNAQDAFGRLKKRNKKQVTIDPVPYSSELSGPSTGASAFSTMSTGSAISVSSPKRSWFNNLFSFKPASCTLLCRDNVANTRERTRRALMDLGVRVAICEIDGVRGLKCRLDEVRDLQGTSTVVKGVRFKVEFARSGGSGTTYNTLVSLTQEKGAQSSFKGIFNSLKTMLESDVPMSPAASTSPATSQGGKFATVPSPAMRQAQHQTQIQSRPGPPVQTQSYGFGAYPTSPHAQQPRSSPNTLSAPPAQHVRWSNSAPNSPIPPSTPRFLPSPRLPESNQLSSPIRM